MSDFIKPKTEYVSNSDYVQKLVNISLKKDLYDNEEVCSFCKGTGLVIAKSPYGLTSDPNKTTMFPYSHQSLTFCPHCFNGIIHRCKLCGEIIERGYTKHNCEQQRELDRKEYEIRRANKLKEAELISPTMLKDMEYFFSDDYGENDGFFTEWEDFFEYWSSEHEPTDQKPEYVWSTESVEMSMDAGQLIENATEDLYEDAYYNISDTKIKELQEYLDKWCSECGVGKTYYEGKYKVRIPWEDYDG